MNLALTFAAGTNLGFHVQDVHKGCDEVVVGSSMDRDDLLALPVSKVCLHLPWTAVWI